MGGTSKPKAATARATSQTKMNRLIVKFWVINFFISIALFVVYRIAIAETKPIDGSWYGKVLFIVDVALGVYSSFIYLVVILLSSLAFFLNLIKGVRENYFLSFLTFSGIPLAGVVYLLPSILIDFYSRESFMRTLVLFSIVYLLITSVEFFMFQKRAKNLK